MENQKICVFSFDDNKIYDYKFVDIIEKYEIKCTFNVNSYCVGKSGYVDKNFIKELSIRHEIASHTVMHEKDLHLSPIEKIREEIINDKEALQEMIGKTVNGFAYPYGQYSNSMIDVLKQAGFKYARTVEDTFSFSVSKDFYRWAPTCHQSKAQNVVEKFKLAKNGTIIIWGHSIEFDGNWDKLIDLCQRLKDMDNVKFITSEQLYEMIAKKENG